MCVFRDRNLCIKWYIGTWKKKWRSLHSLKYTHLRICLNHSKTFLSVQICLKIYFCRVIRVWRNESECYKCCQSWVWFIAKNYPTHTLSLSAFFHYITGHSQSPEQFPYSLYLVQKQFIRIDEKYLPHSITKTLGQVSLSDGHYRVSRCQKVVDNKKIIETPADWNSS